MSSPVRTGQHAPSPRVLELFDRVERFRVGSLHDQAAKWEVTRSPDQIALREAARLGLTGIEVPEALGGLGLGFREKIRVVEILSRTSMAFAFSLINSQNVAARVAISDSERHRTELLPRLLSGYRFGSTALTEPGVGSDFASITTMATKTSSGWRIDGEKAWITNASISDVIICYVQTEADAGRRGIASFLIDGTRPGFSRNEPYSMQASHVAGTGSFVLNGYEADEDDLLAPPGEAFAAALSSVNGARIYIAAMCDAMVRSALATAVEYGQCRKAFGRSILEHQGLAWSLADIANRLEASEALTAKAIDLYAASENNGGAQGTIQDQRDLNDVVLAAAHAKRFATELVEPGIAGCMQAMGAAGLSDEYPLYRSLAEARICSLVDGSTEMQNNRIAHSLVNTYGQSGLEGASTAYDTMSSTRAAAVGTGSTPDTPPTDRERPDRLATANDAEVTSGSVRDAEPEDVLTGMPPMPPPTTLASTASAPPLPPASLRKSDGSDNA